MDACGEVTDAGVRGCRGGGESRGATLEPPTPLRTATGCITPLRSTGVYPGGMRGAGALGMGLEGTGDILTGVPMAFCPPGVPQ